MKALALLLAAAVSPAFAQDLPEYPQMPKSLVQYFVFTAEQTNAIRLLNQEFVFYVIDQLDRMDELDTSISDELERAVPDPALVGKNVVELEMIDRSISEKFETTVVAVQAALTQEQRDKLRLLEEAARLSRTIDLATDWAILRSPDDSGNSLPLLLSPDRTIGAMGQLSEARKGQLKKLLTDRSAKR